MSKKKEQFSVFDHVLVPKHEIVPDSEVEAVLAELRVESKDRLPKILPNDPCVKALKAKRGDVIRILRKEPTGEAVYYRVVV
ncbi:MAG: DNA-directed RNA polymerase subunit H [Candidatus Micrarchaeia archaeon]